MGNWKELDINVDSLWLYGERDKSGKHENNYHGNFIPQIPNQLIRRYTKENELVLDVFMGSGTTLYECETLKRKGIGFDINDDIINIVQSKIKNDNIFIEKCDVTETNLVENKIGHILKILNKNFLDFIIMHPPYMDIIKFTEQKNDLSHIDNIKDFIRVFIKVCKNTLSFLDNNRYFAVVIGDLYRKGEVLPLSFYIMDAIKRNFNVTLKGIVVKNIEGNKGKIGKQSIWKYRALNSDYFIFKHEYIFVFKKGIS